MIVLFLINLVTFHVLTYVSSIQFLYSSTQQSTFQELERITSIESLFYNFFVSLIIPCKLCVFLTYKDVFSIIICYETIRKYPGIFSESEFHNYQRKTLDVNLNYYLSVH